MAVNNRIFYACQAVAFVPSGTTSVGTGHIVHGVQSVGITSNFSLEQAFEFGQVEIYANSEEVGEVEVTCEKLIDGSVGLYVNAAHTQGTNVVAASSKRTDVYLAIYNDTANAVAATTPRDVVVCSGMYISSCSWTWPVDGNATESITMVGNDKQWNDSAAGAPSDDPTTAFGSVDTEIAGSDTPASGLQRRFGGVSIATTDAAYTSHLPDAIMTQGTSDSRHIQNISVSVDFGRENILELGRFGPYYKYATFPVEVTSEFEVIATEGDLVGVSGTNYNLGAGEQITIADTAGTFLDLGDKNKLTSVSYSGGDTGGGNATVTFSYSTFNDLTVRSGTA